MPNYHVTWTKSATLLVYAESAAEAEEVAQKSWGQAGEWEETVDSEQSFIDFEPDAVVLNGELLDPDVARRQQDYQREVTETDK